MEGKTKFSRRLKQFDGLTRLILIPPHILRQIYATDSSHSMQDSRAAVAQWLLPGEPGFVSGCSPYCHWWWRQEGRPVKIALVQQKSSSMYLHDGTYEQESGECCELPQGRSGRSPDRPKVFHYFSTQDGLSWHFNVVKCGLSCSLWGPRPHAPPRLHTPLSARR